MGWVLRAATRSKLNIAPREPALRRGTARREGRAWVSVTERECVCATCPHCSEKEAVAARLTRGVRGAENAHRPPPQPAERGLEWVGALGRGWVGCCYPPAPAEHQSSVRERPEALLLCEGAHDRPNDPLRCGRTGASQRRNGGGIAEKRGRRACPRNCHPHALLSGPASPAHASDELHRKGNQSVAGKKPTTQHAEVIHQGFSEAVCETLLFSRQ